MRNRIISALLVSISAITLFGQTENTGTFLSSSKYEPTEIDGNVFIGGGLSCYTFKPTVGDVNKRAGVIAGFDATFWYNYWGITTGLHYNSYSSLYKLNGVTLSTPSVDGDSFNGNTPESFILQTTYNNISEKITGHYIGIPLQASFMHTFDNELRISGGIGPMLSIRAVSKSKITEGDYTTVGYYPQYGNNATITTGPGFQNYPVGGTTVSNQFGVGISAIANFEVSYPINRKIMIFGGPYFEYQLNGKTPGNAPMSSYTVESLTEANVDYAGIANSNVSDKMRRMAVGFRVGVTFILKQRKHSTKYKTYVPTASKKEARVIQFQPEPMAAEIKSQQDESKLKQADFWYEMEKIEQDRLHKIVKENSPILFNRSGYDLTPESQKRIKNIAAVLFDYPELKITLIGHTCDIGAEEQNEFLGLSRASSVAELLIKEGVSANNLVIDTRGERMPLVPNVSEENRIKNRRVEFIIED